MSCLRSPRDSAELIAQRIVDEHRALAARWLGRLRQLVTEKPNDDSSEPELLDHIPELIARIGRYLGAYDHEDIAANSVVVNDQTFASGLRRASAAYVE